MPVSFGLSSGSELKHHGCILALCSAPTELFFYTYIQGAASIGNVSSGSMVGRAHPSTETTAASHTPLIMPSAAQSHQIPTPFGGSSAPPLPLQDTNAHASHSTNLVTPAFFAPPSPSSASLAPPISSMMPTAPPLHATSSSAQHPQYGHGTPLLQPFPPPAPPPSFAPAHNNDSVISRDKVKDALLRLVQVCSLSKITICTVLLYVSNSHVMFPTE